LGHDEEHGYRGGRGHVGEDEKLGGLVGGDEEPRGLIEF